MTRGGLDISGTRVCVPIMENCSHLSLSVFVEMSGTGALPLHPPIFSPVFLA